MNINDLETSLNELYIEEIKSQKYFNERTIKDKEISKKNYFEIDNSAIHIKKYNQEYEDIYQKTFDSIKKNFNIIKRKAAQLIAKDAKIYNKNNEDGWKAKELSENEIYKNITLNSNYKNKKYDPFKTSKHYPSYIKYEIDNSRVNIDIKFYGEGIPHFEMYYYYYPDKNKLEYDDYLCQY